MKHYTIDGYTRVSKARARKMYNDGETVYFCACNLRPGKPYFPEIAVNKEYDFQMFENRINAFEFYNCTCNETGRYAAFYIKEGN